MKQVYDVLRRPLVTEKSSGQKSANRQVSLEVATWANKAEIKKAAKELFGVGVESVRTAVVRGKMKRVGTTSGRRSNWKKAILTLSAEADLDVFGVTPEVPAAPSEE